MKKETFEQLKTIKKSLQKEGFVIDGVVGSSVADNEYGDIDIVYHLENIFFQKYKGFKAINKIEEIRNILQRLLKIKVDLIDRDYTNNIMKNVINRDMLNV